MTKALDLKPGTQRLLCWLPLALGMALLLISTAHAVDAQQAPWGYTGPGAAEHWGDLRPDFATCKLGNEQSPIDIRSAKKRASAPRIGFAYTTSAADVVNAGSTIQVNLSSGGHVKLASGAYELVQFHFHAPSEERINGKSYPMVAHLVHKNEAGKLTVVGVLFKIGKANPTLAKVFAEMPAQGGGKATLAGGLNAADLLPAKRAYYAFMGSLTTPPCSEGVQWQVLKSPVEMSQSQLDAFRKLYPMNARPVQPLNGRKVEEIGS